MIWNPSLRTHTVAAAALLCGSNLALAGAQVRPAVPRTLFSSQRATQGTTTLHVELSLASTLRLAADARDASRGAHLCLTGGSPGAPGLIAVGAAARAGGRSLSAAQLFPGHFDAQGSLHLELPSFAGELHALGFELARDTTPARLVLGPPDALADATPGTLAADVARILQPLADGERARLFVLGTVSLGAEQATLDAGFELGRRGDTLTLVDLRSGQGFHARDAAELATLIEAVATLQAFEGPAAELAVLGPPREENHAVPGEAVGDGGSATVEPPPPPFGSFESTPFQGDDPLRAGAKWPPVPREENHAVPFDGELGDGGDVVVVEPPPLVGGIETTPLSAEPERAGGDKHPPVPHKKTHDLAFDGTLEDGGGLVVEPDPALIDGWVASALPGDPQQGGDKLPLGPRRSASGERLGLPAERAALDHLRVVLSRHAD